MGLASSQARLLTLTTRMHQIEYKAQKIEAEQLQLANQARRVNDEYLAALETTKIEKSILNTDTSVTFNPLTALDIYTFNSTGKQYVLEMMNGKTLIPASIHNAFNNTDSLSEFLKGYEIGKEGVTLIHHDEVLPPDYNNSLAKAFEDAGEGCFKRAVNDNNVGCYAHVLAHIIDYTAETGFGTDGCNEDFYNDSTRNNYTTSIGNSFSINSFDITGAGMDDKGETRDQTMTMVSEYINHNQQVTVLKHDKTFEETDLSTDIQKLASMYNTDGTTKTIKQWAIDLYYLCKHCANHEAEVAPTIKNFQWHLSSELDADYQPPYDEPVDTIIADSKPKAQWYSNIWNLLNDTAVSNVNDEPGVYQTKDGDMQVGYEVITKPKNESSYYINNYFNTYENENYVVIPDDMLNSSEWLTNMINSGYAILRVYDSKDEEMEYTSVAVDTNLREVPDEKALRKAEAKYEAELKKIDTKDRRYDWELAAIENERNAIKNEMETLKTVSKDNVERTFKLFG